MSRASENEHFPWNNYILYPYSVSGIDYAVEEVEKIFVNKMLNLNSKKKKWVKLHYSWLSRKIWDYGLKKLKENWVLN